jgi:hypothetical protein
MLWWAFDARKWFKGPVRNIDLQNVIFKAWCQSLRDFSIHIISSDCVGETAQRQFLPMLNLYLFV